MEKRLWGSAPGLESSGYRVWQPYPVIGKDYGMLGEPGGQVLLGILNRHLSHLSRIWRTWGSHCLFWLQPMYLWNVGLTAPAFPEDAWNVVTSEYCAVIAYCLLYPLAYFCTFLILVIASTYPMGQTHSLPSLNNFHLRLVISFSS